MKSRRILFLFYFIFFLLNSSACVFVDVKTPLDKNVRDTTIGPKMGVSTTHSVAWLFAWGDAGTAAAAKNGGISKISHLDARYYSILFGLYAKRETIAYGE